ncbi:caspase family protein [Rhizobium sp. CSW-27]|uniref:caspase family protein n=1 Tax=Rhizobium sp. CSW-27 TaxID=2839985 RepID=UPI001C00C218|nr:caspase family protein [Rhizobium sp. CSW-27]MBT9373070.1 caspase family protein [Rhizobium sp. CSW-27]
MCRLRKLASVLFRIMLAFAVVSTQAGLHFSPASAAVDPAEGRVALVVGNANYRNVPKLKNSVRDAALVAKALRDVGFDVVEKTDVSRRGFEAAVKEAIGKAKGASTILFYFAGHGFQLNGRNYLVPTDAALKDRKKITQETMSLDDLITQLSVRDRQTIVFLDACRDNPIPQSARAERGSEGLAQIETGSGLFVAFATQPGNVTADGKGDNSPFSLALAAQIPEEGQSISDMMINVRNMVEEKTLHRQTPWDQSSLRSQFYFKPAPEEESAEWTEEELAELQAFAKANPAFLEKFKKSFRGLKIVEGEEASGAEVASLRIEPAEADEAGPAPGSDAPQAAATEPLASQGVAVDVVDRAGEPAQPEAVPPARNGPALSEEAPVPVPEVATVVPPQPEPAPPEPTPALENVPVERARPGLQILAATEADDDPTSATGQPPGFPAEQTLPVTAEPAASGHEPNSRVANETPLPAAEGAIVVARVESAPPTTSPATSPVPDKPAGGIDPVPATTSAAPTAPAAADVEPAAQVMADGPARLLVQGADDDERAPSDVPSSDNAGASVGDATPERQELAALPPDRGAPAVPFSTPVPLPSVEDPAKSAASLEEGRRAEPSIVPVEPASASPEPAQTPVPRQVDAASDSGANPMPDASGAIAGEATAPVARPLEERLDNVGPVPENSGPESGSMELAALAPDRQPATILLAPPAPDAVDLPPPAPAILPDPEQQTRMAMAAQKELSRLGCYVGGVDGNWGSRSAKALLRYYSQKKAQPDELEPTEGLVARLQSEPVVICKSAPSKPKPSGGDATAAGKSAPGKNARSGTGNATVSATAGKPAPALEKLKKFSLPGAYR